jgi:uncharacterized protein (TIGR01777 family)
VDVARESTGGCRRLRIRSQLPVPADRAFAWHEHPGAFERLVPPWQRLAVERRAGTIRNGDRTVMTLRKGPLRRRWVAVHGGYVPGEQFADEQAEGPFAEWSHVHRFHANGPGSVLEDDITYRLPLGAVGSLLADRIVERELRRAFAFRHRRLLHDLERHATTSETFRVAVTGASGLIGGALSAFLASGGHDVVSLVRRPPGEGEARWDPATGTIDHQALEGVDAVVHLAGAPIAHRWTPARKRSILESRVRGTRLIAEALAVCERKPRVLVCASAIGIYGSEKGDEVLSETSPPGTDFLAGVCEGWEAAADPAREAGIRVVHLRIGVVLEALLRRLALPFRLGVGGRIGRGRQWLSWAALDDVVGAVHHAVADDSLVGAVNVVAPAPVTNADFAKTLGAVLRRPAVLPVPAPLVKLAYGEMGEHVLLGGQRVRPERLEDAGFRFSFPALDGALRHVLGRDPTAADATGAAA